MACGCDLNQLSFVGLVGMCDPPRPGVKAAIDELLNGEVDVKMITGDAKETGEAIGKISSGGRERVPYLPTPLRAINF